MNLETKYLKEQEMKRNYEKEKQQIHNVEALEKMGNIKEAAAVFSQQGMEIFYNMFVKNPVEGAIEKVISQKMLPMIEQAVENKMMEFMKGYMNGMMAFAGKVTQTTIDFADKKLEKQMKQQEDTGAITIDEEPEQLQMVHTVAEPVIKIHNKKESTRTKEAVNKDLEMLVPFLKDLNEPVMVKELVNKLPDVKWGVSPWSRMQILMKHDPNIKSLNRGYYSYEN
ncbi:MAG TPA: hypothetical protein VK190_04845 [Pseudoneobacillus sp.]|nr:hypothetical protein [Pseudoneobacillus sp.]